MSPKLLSEVEDEEGMEMMMGTMAMMVAMMGPKGSNLTLLHPKVISESAFTIKSAFDVKSAFRYHFCYQKRF